ncbi:hypothetical protein C7B80_30070 [Cyanosarcina cf. burmensis CCALA 770]|nr:hypothetical protein C7B80_30070 [Cyanosarcina cf. burmensis CCALA 770]
MFVNWIALDVAIAPPFNGSSQRRQISSNSAPRWAKDREGDTLCQVVENIANGEGVLGALLLPRAPLLSVNHPLGKLPITLTK